MSSTCTFGLSLPREDLSMVLPSLKIFPCYKRPFNTGLPSPHHLSRFILHFLLEQNWTIDSSPNTQLCLKSFALTYVAPFDSNNPFPRYLPKEQFFWRQVILKKISVLSRSCMWNSKHMLLLPTSCFYFKCKPYCSSPVKIILHYCLFSWLSFCSLSETSFKTVSHSFQPSFSSN